ncbi:MAG: DUF368 domain-containing protein [Elusimicrobiota bacterium]
MIINITKGFLIGIANIIPGVSGGTFALILGIYDRLIAALSSIDIEFIRKAAKPSEFFVELKKRDQLFLIQILVGALAAIGMFSWIVDYLLKNYSGMTLAFFFGLIVPSICIPYGMIRDGKVKNFLFILPGVLLVWVIYNIKFGITDISLPVVFAGGMLAISAMILPGISGSFVLLIIGLYEEIVLNIKVFTSSMDTGAFIVLSVFGAGCITGLLLFVRLMKILLKKHRNSTLCFLIGLVIGSAVVLWPFKEYPEPGDGKTEIAVTTAKNRMPAGSKETVFYSLAFLGGFIGAAGMNRIAKAGHK